jgi:hypothetical protein
MNINLIFVFTRRIEFLFLIRCLSPFADIKPSLGIYWTETISVTHNISYHMTLEHHIALSYVIIRCDTLVSVSMQHRQRECNLFISWRKTGSCNF